MSQPTMADIHVNGPLTQLSIGYRQAADEFIAGNIFPVVPVQKQSDIYYEFLRDAFFRSDAQERAGGTESAGTGFTLKTSGPYYSRVYAVHQDVPAQLRANADAMLDLDMSATELVTNQMLIKRDSLFLTNYFTTGLWTGVTGAAQDLAGVTTAGAVDATHFLRWDQAGSQPREDVRTAQLTVKQLTGRRPNVLVLGPFVTNALLSNPELLDAIKYTGSGGIVSPEDLALLAKFFGVEKVVSAEAVQNTATEGATLAMSFMAGKHALLAYAAPNPGLMTPSAGYIFAWQGYVGGSDIAISKWYNQDRKADRIEAEMSFDQKLTCSDMGVFFASATS